jgi:glycosyltransferase involved in cell wall biosynthesis
MDILYFKPSNSSFVLIDQQILERNFSVKPYFINNKNGLIYIFTLIRLTAYLILHGRRVKIYFIRFADWHTALLALFEKIYRKKLILVIGGFDAFHLPEYKYGVYHRKFRGWCAKYSIRNASLILPNSPYLVESTNSYASDVPFKGGIRHFVKNIRGKVVVVHNGFDPEYWLDEQEVPKKNTIVTVANVKSLRNYYLKGIDSFIELARILPGYTFRIIGLNEEFLKQNAELIKIPDNLEVIEFVRHQDLKRYYREAKVFCLLSLTEGMSNVLCEAMLCECIPVGSDVSIIPDIIGNTGFIIKHRDILEIKQQVLNAINDDKHMGKLARQRIIDNFTLEKREMILCSLIRQQMD